MSVMDQKPRESVEWFQERLGDCFAKAVSETLKLRFIGFGAPEDTRAMLASPTVTHYKISGAFSGEFALFYSAAARSWVTKRFLEINPGLPETTPDIEDVACLEVTNIILGHLTGALSDNGAQVAINAPGVAISAADFSSDVPGFVQGEGTIVAAACPGGLEETRLVAWSRVAPSQATRQQNKTVLIVDDSPAMTAFLEKVFRENGYAIAGIATDGVEALEKFERTNPDIVTLDIIMPKLKGTEVLKRIIEKKPNAKVVMASSVSDARTVMQCLKIGAKRYIIKPYDAEAVIEAVEKTLGI